MSCAGILIGPALVGWSAELVGLGWTLAGLVPLLIGVVLNARLIAFADRDRRVPATGCAGHCAFPKVRG
ncbi:hypothetical protein V1634_09260 [Plantactinospora veratri]|uniref:Major facilitator superfamily (MFS) profile domain-containing protein n=1 Tax=Plantactinospora veratri TaxID=1436122 RepID=A0ABU7SAP4_9ACTN